MMDDLKPCPFCGGEAELKNADMDDTIFYMRCKNCKARTKEFYNKTLLTYPVQRVSGAENAKKAWNRRVDGKPEDDNIIEIKINEKVIRDIILNRLTKID